jgi:DnaJ family protein A protein 3
VLSDDVKRREYDAYGQTTEQMERNGEGSGGFGFRERGFDANKWNFSSTIDPEELFRKIFGFQQGRRGYNEETFDDFAESYQGNQAAQEVIQSKSYKNGWNEPNEIICTFS